MWTPNIISIKRDGLQLKILVGFLSDAGVSTSEEYTFISPDLENLKAQIRNRITVLTAQDNFNLPTGTIDTTPAPAPVLTQAQIDQNQFMQDYQLWLQVKHGIDVGVLTGTETPVVNLKAKVQSEFKASYLNLL